MAKAGLRDDFPRATVPVFSPGSAVGLADDCPCEAAAPAGWDDVWPPALRRVTLYGRTRAGYEPETGDPVWTWAQIGEGAASSWEVREELDDEPGTTKITLTAAVGNEAGLAFVPESSQLAEADGTLWLITSTSTTSEIITVEAERFTTGEGFSGPLPELPPYNPDDDGVGLDADGWPYYDRVGGDFGAQVFLDGEDWPEFDETGP